MGALSQITTPYLVLGECKSFNRFEEKDFERARRAGQLFPGAVLCFCTFNDWLDPSEIKGLKRIVEAGRESLDGTDSRMASGVVHTGGISEVCEFTQGLYLDMPSSHEVSQAKIRKRRAKKQVKPIVPGNQTAVP